MVNDELTRCKKPSKGNGTYTNLNAMVNAAAGINPKARNLAIDY